MAHWLPTMGAISDASNPTDTRLALPGIHWMNDSPSLTEITFKRQISGVNPAAS